MTHQGFVGYTTDISVMTRTFESGQKVVFTSQANERPHQGTGVSITPLITSADKKDDDWMGKIARIKNAGDAGQPAPSNLK